MEVFKTTHKTLPKSSLRKASFSGKIKKMAAIIKPVIYIFFLNRYHFGTTYPSAVQSWASVAAHSWRGRRSQSGRHSAYAAHCWLNADKSSKTLPNTTTTLSLLYCCRNVPFPRLHLRRWPNIETALGDCSVFAVTAHYYASDPLHLPSSEKPLPMARA